VGPGDDAALRRAGRDHPRSRHGPPIYLAASHRTATSHVSGADGESPCTKMRAKASIIRTGSDSKTSGLRFRGGLPRASSHEPESAEKHWTRRNEGSSTWESQPLVGTKAVEFAASGSSKIGNLGLSVLIARCSPLRSPAPKRRQPTLAHPILAAFRTAPSRLFSS